MRKQADADALVAEGNTLIRPVLFDVTDAARAPAVAKEVAATLRAEGRSLAALINNAGISGSQKVVAFAGAEHYESVLATNVAGMARVTETLLPLLQAFPGGGARIVNIGSFVGSLAPALQFIGPYVASKFAVEGVSDMWRRTLKPTGVAVSLVKPGSFATGMNQLANADPDLSPVIDAVHDAVTSPRPLARYYPGQIKGTSCSVFCKLFLVIPDCIADRAIALIGTEDNTRHLDAV